MSDYRIEKVRRRVTISLSSGAMLEGDIFLQAHARFRNGPEEPFDVLNDDDPFLPLQLMDDAVILVQKAQIATVITGLPTEDDVAVQGVPGMHVDLTFIDGSTRQGSIFPELRADRPRLVDFLNNTRARFLPVFATDELLLVNRAHIAYARPVT